MKHQYKTARGCERAIKSLQNRIKIYESLKGTHDGTFWQDINAVDKSIFGMKADIELLKNRISILKGEYSNKLINELRASEIF